MTTAVVMLATACGPSEARKAEFRKDLVAIANDVEKRPMARPVPTLPAVPGSFGEAFDAAAEERSRLDATAGIAIACAPKLAAPGDAVDAGKQACLGDLAATAPALAKLLDLRRRERPGTPPSVHPFAPMTAAPGVHRALSTLCQRAAVEIDADLVRGHPTEAFATCESMLEVARDYEFGANLTGAMVVSTCLEKLEPPCSRAIGALAPEGKGAAHTSLEVVAASLRPFTEVFDSEIASVHLGLCGGLLDAPARATLAPRALSAVEAAERGNVVSGGRDQKMLVALCLEGFEDMRRAARAYRAPPKSAERAALLAERASHETKMTKIDYDRYEEKMLAAEARVRGLSSRALP